MKLFAISDLHLSKASDKPMELFGAEWKNHWSKIIIDWKSKVSDDDIVLIAGDISWAMRLEEAIFDLNDIAECPGRKVLIRGNHDYWWSSVSKIRKLLLPSMYIIHNDALRIGNLIFAGSRGWTVPEIGQTQSSEDKKLYEREKLRLEISLERAESMKTSEDIVIGMMHYPPFSSRYDDSHFTRLFSEHNVRLVIYGHLHGELSRIKPTYVKNNIPYYLTSCDKLNFKLLEISLN
ncbi:MAG: metallophosphoesterase [Christensenellaceae bacterium]|jgi:predicted phosphohydrolase|nr:metallophosphoesterase [Christensenellaceae bacterium]